MLDEIDENADEEEESEVEPSDDKGASIHQEFMSDANGESSEYDDEEAESEEGSESEEYDSAEEEGEEEDEDEDGDDED